MAYKTSNLTTYKALCALRNTVYVVAVLSFKHLKYKEST